MPPGCGGERPRSGATAENGGDDPTTPSATLSAGPPRTTAQADNVLLVTIDTWRFDAAGFAGNESASTPTLDRLAAGGLRFEQAHALNVLTLPSHANILTGRPPFEHGVRDNAGFHLGEDHRTLAETLASAGFVTAAFVAAFPLDSAYGLDQGFEIYDDRFPKGTGPHFSMAERSGREVVDRGLAWWTEHRGERRFLWLHLYEPHTPYTASAKNAAAVGGDPYLAEVAEADGFLAEILTPLMEGTDPDADNTLVLVTSDHGESLGEHGEATHGLFAYDSTLRVPLIVWGTGLQTETTPEPVNHLDIVPTVLDAAGLDVDPTLPGRSLLEPAERPETNTYFEALNGTLLRGWAPLRGVVESRWDGERWQSTKAIDLPVPELYDLDADPRELDNLLPEARPVAERLLDHLPAESQWPPQAGTVSEEQRRALESLGYLAGSGPTDLPTSFSVADDPKNLIELDQLIHRYIDEYRTGRLGEAIATARLLVESRPQMGLGHYHLARALLENGDRRQALRVLSDAYRTGATTPELVRQLGLLLSETGRSTEAVRVLEPLLPSGDIESQLAYAQAAADNQQFQASRDTLDRVLERDPENARAWETRALVSIRATAWERALEEGERALELNPDLALAWNYLGVAHYNLGRPRDALEAWRRSLEIDPGDLDVLYNLGLVAAEARQFVDARRALERFVEQADPNFYGGDIQRASTLLQQLPR